MATNPLVNGQGLDRLAGGGVSVHPDYLQLAALHPPLKFVTRLGDLRLRIAALHGNDHPAHPINLLEFLPAQGLEPVGQGFHVVTPCERIDRFGDPGLAGDDLLRTQRQQRGIGRGQGVRLVESVRVEGLRPPEHGCQRLEGGAHQVDLRLLRSQ